MNYEEMTSDQLRELLKMINAERDRLSIEAKKISVAMELMETAEHVSRLGVLLALHQQISRDEFTQGFFN